MLRKNACLIVAALCLCWEIQAQAGQPEERRNDSPGISFFREIYNHPAAKNLSPYSSQGTIDANYTYYDHGNYHFLSEGDNRSAFSIQADGFLLQEKNRFWGIASYTNSSDEQVQWTQVTDMDRLGGIGIIADSIGGNVYGERYTAKGGFARYSGKWTWGAEAGFDGKIHFRKVDPRPKTITTDVQTKMSLAYTWKRYQTGGSVFGGLYRQELQTTIKNQHAKYDFFVFRGFGLPDYNESGKGSSFSWQYEGKNYGISLFTQPLSPEGFFVHAGYEHSNIDSFDKNARYPFSFTEQGLSGVVGYQNKKQETNTQIKLNIDYQTGKGIERIYNYQEVQEDSYDYRLLSEAKRYTRNKGLYEMVGLREWFSQKQTVWLGSTVGYRMYEEKFNAIPQSGLQYSVLYEHLTMNIRSGLERKFETERSSIFADVQLHYALLLNEAEKTPSGDEIFDKAKRPDLEVLSDKPASISGQIRYQFPFTQESQIYIAAQGGSLLSGKYQRYHIGLSVGFYY